MKKLKYSILSIIILCGGAGYWFYSSRDSGPQYREAVIEKGNITIKILTTGTIQPENRLEIKPPVAGRVEDVLVKEGQKVHKGQILAWLSSNERAALIDAARSQGDSEVKQWEEMYKPTPLVAPLSGMIIRRNVESGQTFSTNDAVLVMSNRLTVKAQVDETDLAQIYLKQKSKITLDAYPEKEIPAQVDQIAFEAKTVNNVTTYVIDVLPDETPEYMRSGMTANVTFIGKTKSEIVLVPNEFIKYENGKPTVLVKTEKTPVVRELQIGLTDGKNSEVLSGLNEKETALLAINRKEAKATNPFSPMGQAKGKRGGK